MNVMLKPAYLYRKELIVGAFYLILTIALTWPITPNLSTSLHANGDPMLVSWIIYHGQKHLLSFDFDFFNTNTFYPFQNNLAYTDHSIAIALITLPFRIFTSDPVAIFNIGVLLSYFLSAVGAFLLSRYYTGNLLASVTAGIIFAFCPFHVAQIGHLQILTYQWIPFAILYFEKFLKTSRSKHIILFSVFFLLQALSTIYHFVFLTLALILIFVTRLWIRDFRLTWKNFIQLLGAGLVIVLVMLPFLMPYIKFSKQYNVERTLSESMPYSADLMDFLTIPLGWFWYDTLTGKFDLPNIRAAVEHSLFPGGTAAVAFVILIFLYLFLRIKRSARINDMVVYILLTLFAAVLATGPILKKGGNVVDIEGFSVTMPYTFLYHIFYPLHAIRVPERIGVIFMLGMAVSTAIVLDSIFRHIKHRIVRNTLLILISLFVIVEYIVVPFPVLQFESPYTKKNLWIRDHTPSDAIIFELTEAISGVKGGYLEVEAVPMLASAVHERRTINGYSGFFPPEWFRLRWDIIEDFGEQMLAVLKAMGNVYIVYNKQYDFVIKESTLRLLDEQYSDEKYTIFRINDAVAKAITNQKPSPIVQIFDDYINIQWANYSDSVYYNGEDFTTVKIGNENKITIVDNPVYQKSKSLLTKPIAITKPYTNSILIINEDTVITADIVAEPNIQIEAISSKYSAKANANFTIDLKIKNNSPYKISSNGKFPVLVGYKWKDASDQEMTPGRSPLKKALRLNETIVTPVFCKAPSQPGKYTILLTLVQEHIKWFNDANNNFAVLVEVEVI